jgi:ABC-2 type transport system ATP-binding protein
MDEAGRCERVGFMRNGKILVEGKPDDLRAALNGRILEIYGEPLQLLRKLARADRHVEDAQMFGDRIHIRIQPGTTQEVAKHLQSIVPALGGKITRLRPIKPQLEDVFIELLEAQPKRNS